MSLKRKKPYLPHRHFFITEEKDVDLSRHLIRFLHVNIVVEEMLDGRYLPEWLQLLEVRALLLGLVSTCTEGWLWLEIGQTV